MDEVHILGLVSSKIVLIKLLKVDHELTCGCCVQLFVTLNL
jgi:hypothetical protein